MRVLLGIGLVSLVATLAYAQRGAPPPGQPPGAPPTRAGQGGRGRGAIQVMTLSSPAWQDGGVMPAKHTQAGGEVSPPLAWSNVPDGVASFVLIVRDADVPAGNTVDDTLHWLVWNIPGDARSLPEGVPQGSPTASGLRQVSATGPNYRGPGAPAAGAPHHYVFELYGLDAPVDVPALSTAPAQTRAAVLAAMAGHIRAKAALVALFKRP